MSTDFKRQLQHEFEIPAPVATWVVLTHIWVLAVPLAVIWAVDVTAGALPIAFPTLIKIASAVYIAATAFEVAQNSADRWYLTEATRSVADLFFNSFMTLAFCLYTIGFANNLWMNIAAILLTAAYPFAYIRNHPAHRGLSSAVVLLGTISLYLVSGDPAAFVFLVVNFFAVYLIILLTRGGSQWLHGWAALFFGIAFLAWPWAIINAASGGQLSWLQAGAISIGVVLFAALLTPWVKTWSPTPRLNKA